MRNLRKPSFEAVDNNQQGTPAIAGLYLEREGRGDLLLELGIGEGDRDILLQRWQQSWNHSRVVSLDDIDETHLRPDGDVPGHGAAGVLASCLGEEGGRGLGRLLWPHGDLQENYDLWLTVLMSLNNVCTTASESDTSH